MNNQSTRNVPDSRVTRVNYYIIRCDAAVEYDLMTSRVIL